MRNNDSLFRKAYNNHHDKNGSDVSSTADDLMRSDIGDGVSLDGENFSNANGDGFNPDVVFESDAGLSWDPYIIKFFIEAIHNKYGCNPNVDLDAVNQIVSQYLSASSSEGMVGNSEFLGEVRSVYMYACGLNQPPSSEVDIIDGAGGDVSVDTTGGQGTILGNIIDVVSGTNPPNPYVDTQSIPSWITPNAPGLPDIQSCSGITSELYQMYSPYLTAYTAFNFNVDGGSIGNILNQLEGQNIGFYTGEAMRSYDNYIALVIAGLLCAAGVDESSSPDLDSFWSNLPENCQLQSYSGNGNDGANGEPIPPNEPIPTDDGGMVAPIDNSNIDTSATDRPRNFSNANGENNQALIQQLNYIKNWFKDNPIDRDMFASSESFEIYHIGNGEMGGGASSLYQMQSQAFNSEHGENSWAVNRFKSLQDWYKVGNFIEMFFDVFVRIANCLPTDVKNACTSLLQEIMARNTEFFIVETDERQQFIDLFQELGMPIPPNFFREYTSLEYNELANQLAQSEGMITTLTSEIGNLNTQYIMVQNELNTIMNMMEYEQGITEGLEYEIAELMSQKADLEAELMMFMQSLAQMQYEYMQVIEENGMLQAELGASNQLQVVLQDQFDTAVMNEMALQNMVDNLQQDLQSSNAEIADLQRELNDVLAELVQSLEVGDSLQNELQTQLANSNSQISQLTSQIADLQTQLAITEGQIEANTINQQDVAYYENQISNLNQANQSLLLTIQEMEMQTGQTATDLGSGIVEVQGQIDMKTGKGTIQILKGKPQRPVREKKPTISKDGKRLNFVAHNPKKDLNPWSYMDGEHRRFNNSYDLDN